MTPPEKWPPSVHNAIHDEQAAIREAQAHLSRKPSQKWQRRIQQARCRIWVLMMCHMAVIALAGGGCAAYNKTGWWAPDTANYTLSRDRMTGDLTDYWGLSWTLKDSGK